MKQDQGHTASSVNMCPRQKFKFLFSSSPRKVQGKMSANFGKYRIYRYSGKQVNQLTDTQTKKLNFDLANL